MKLNNLPIRFTKELPMFPSLYDDDKPRKTITELKCPECGAIKNRDHEVGDFVFKKLEDEICPKCKHVGMIINSIHDIIDPDKKK
ncbi:MAG: hypothetical protein GF329_05160 [Candidatus Lokiarchaeota archaeon]|nr:hypothetical protein [Candidatus Lokiarchaeota archaeon]